jgi:hypothetical protein
MSAFVSRRYHNFRHAKVCIEEFSDGRRVHEARVVSSEAQRIADLGEVPADKRLLWGIRLSGLVSMIVIIEMEEKVVTRRKLLSELSKLRRLTSESKVPPIAAWLIRDLHFFETQRCLRPLGGAPLFPPKKHNSADELVRSFEHVDSVKQAASLRVERGLTDVTALRELARDVFDWVLVAPETRQEELAAKRALDRARLYVADEMLNIWLTILDRPLKVTKPLIAMTSAVYGLCHLDMKFEAVKKQLHESAKLRRAEIDPKPVRRRRRGLST